MSMHRIRSSAAVLLGGVLVALAVTFLAPQPALAQLNFRPLDRGDVKEMEQRLVVVRSGEGKEFALELGGEFGMQLRDEKAKDLDGLDSVTRFDQDFRLKFRTWFHQDVAMVLTLQTVPESLDDANLRGEPADSRNDRLRDGKTLTLGAREAYLQWNANPNSHLLFGKQEVSLGDRRGKVYDALMPAAQFDCKAGTWCMPLGAVKIGEGAADWIYNWALEYRAWDETRNNQRDLLEVEVFRIIYTETNVPLGKNLGPAYLNRDCPDGTAFSCAGEVSASQITDQSGDPIYYDAVHQNYGGLRVTWLGGPAFANFDYTSAQGQRQYHRYRDPEGGIVGQPDYGTPGKVINRKVINGNAWELEGGYRWAEGRVGLRFMSATGDSAEDTDTGQAYLRALQGYHEITPGSYRGTRLYFNGADTAVELGAGLGHSVNNTVLTGIFLDVDSPDEKKLGYSGGVYQLARNQPVRDAKGDLVKDIGVEVNNMLTWYVHKALKLQFELNVLQPGGAFALDDFTVPDEDQNLLVQGIVRLVYRF